MDLIIFYLNKYNKELISKDYLKYKYRTCHIFTTKEYINSILSELEEFEKKSKFIISIINLNLKEKESNSIKIKDPEIIFIIYPVVSDSHIPFINEIKEILDQNLDYNARSNQERENPREFLIDFSLTPLPLGFDYYFLFLKYIHVDNLDIKIITWYPNYDSPKFFLSEFIDPAGQIILDLISMGCNTIQSLQSGYSNYKKLDKDVSQPFISKNISNLLKKNLIKETWIEGYKNFTIMTSGKLIAHSESYIKKMLQDENATNNISEIKTPALINKAILSFRNFNTKTFENTLEELSNREDLKENDLLRLINEVNDFKNEALMLFLEKTIMQFSNNDVILMKLVQFYISQNIKQKIKPILKKVMQINPENPDAWRLFGKMLSQI